jgi:PAS domain S-box-containing protein
MLRTTHNALHNAGNAILIADPESKIDYANPATARLWGFASASALTGQPLDSLFRDKAAVAKLLALLNADLSADGRTLAAVRADGSVFNVGVSASRNRDSDGKTTGSVLSFSDLTEREKHLTAEADAARMRATLARLDDLHRTFRARLDGLRESFADISANLACAVQDSACKTVLAKGADCVESLAATLAEAEEVMENGGQ